MKGKEEAITVIPKRANGGRDQNGIKGDSFQHIEGIELKDLVLGYVWGGKIREENNRE